MTFLLATDKASVCCKWYGESNSKPDAQVAWRFLRQQVMLLGLFPTGGSWLDVEFDAKNLLFLELIEEKNLTLAHLLKSMGLDDEENIE